MQAQGLYQPGYNMPGLLCLLCTNYLVCYIYRILLFSSIKSDIYGLKYQKWLKSDVNAPILAGLGSINFADPKKTHCNTVTLAL